MDMLDRMQSGRFKVFKEHLDWWEEFRLYHRKDGKVVKEGDDLMCATRYALMMFAPCLNGAKLPKLQTQTRLPQIERSMSEREFVVWRTLATD